jgi:hypothetical protein
LAHEGYFLGDLNECLALATVPAYIAATIVITTVIAAAIPAAIAAVAAIAATRARTKQEKNYGQKAFLPLVSEGLAWLPVG